MKAFLENIDWNKLNNDKGKVTAEIIFKDSVSRDEFHKLFNNVFEVEILNASKKIEKIKELKFDIFNKKQKPLYENMVTLANKLNEVIDKLNEMENKKMTDDEFVKEFCSKCINRKGFDDVCEIRKNIKGEPQCINFEKEKKENNE